MGRAVLFSAQFLGAPRAEFGESLARCSKLLLNDRAPAALASLVRFRRKLNKVSSKKRQRDIPVWCGRSEVSLIYLLQHARLSPNSAHGAPRN